MLTIKNTFFTRIFLGEDAQNTTHIMTRIRIGNTT